MQISKNISKISWSLADKATFVLYGIATVAVLSITNEIEFGIFILFNNLHNFVLTLAALLGTQSMLQFSADENEKPRINAFSMINFIVIIVLLVGLIFIFREPIAEIMQQPHFITIAQSLLLLALFSIPRYFSIIIMYRELKMFQIFLTNLVYFGTMSGMIFYNIYCANFLNYIDIIYITYVGSALAAVVSFVLTFKYWKFSFKGKTKYTEILNFSTKFAVNGVIMPIPRMLDVFVIQYFWGTSMVGLYAPAKTIFRFIEDGMNTINYIIYSPIVKYFAANDKLLINKTISKSISFLVIGFCIITLLCWIFGDIILSYFLPAKFIEAIPFLNILMLASIILPFTLITVAINASGKTGTVAKYTLYSFPFWLASYFIIGTFCNEYEILIAFPYFVFALVFACFLFNYAHKNFDLRFSQVFRVIPDFVALLKAKFK